MGKAAGRRGGEGRPRRADRRSRICLPAGAGRPLWRLLILLLLLVAALAVAGCAPSEAELVQVLKTSTDSAERNGAAIDLAKLGSVAATQELIRAAGADPVARQGLNALREQYAASLVALAAHEPSQKDATAIAGSIECLRLIGDGASAEALGAFVVAPGAYLLDQRLRAVEALGSLQGPEALAALVGAATIRLVTPDWNAIRQAAASALQARPEAVEPLLAARSTWSEDAAVCATIDTILVGIGTPAVEPLAALLAGGDWPVEVLVRIGAPSVSAAAAELEDQAAMVRYRALSVLLRLYAGGARDAAGTVLTAAGRVPLLLEARFAAGYDETLNDAIGEVLVAAGKPAATALITRAASLLTDAATWTDATTARVIYDLLLRFDSTTDIQALVAKVTSDESDRLHVLFLALKLGIEGSEESLVEALNVHGDVKMGEDYLNSGSQALHDGAVQWGKSHGYYVTDTGGGSHRVAWGAF